MINPLARIKEEKGNHLKFSNVHSPKMKSVYWRHFGFPTNEDNTIITKQSVVCILCHKVLTNHGNTTNLRAHLQHRHKEIFNNMIRENGIKVPPRKPQMKALTARPKRNVANAKIKSEYPAVSNSGSLGTDDQAVLYETMVPITYEDDDVIDTDNFTKVDVGSGAQASVEARNSESNSDIATIVLEQPKHKINKAFLFSSVDEDDSMFSYTLLDTLVQMFVNDLHNTDIMNDSGFVQLLRTISGKMKLPAIEKIENLIREQHSDKFTTLADNFKMHSQHKPFSLGFEIWRNIHQCTYLSVYFNYTTESPDYTLINQLYSTTEYNKFTSIEAIFEEFNMKNCSAAIVNYDCDDYLKHYLQSKNIPVILSVDSTVDKCLRNVFVAPAISAIMEEVKDVVMHYAHEINSKDVEVPNVLDEFPWTNFEFLKFFTESVSWPEDMEMLVNSAKSIVETLSILSVTLDTLKSEEIPHSSMLSPIITKILGKKLEVSTTDDDNVALMKQIIVVELEKHVLCDDYLTLSALLDPRFHRLTNVDNIDKYLKILTDKYQQIREFKGIDPNTLHEIAAKEAPPTRKSNLERFFGMQETVEEKSALDVGNIDVELKRYRKSVFCNLDDSPFVWWHKMGHLYPALKHIAAQYQCVPCVVNMNFKKPIKQQLDHHRRRFMLTGTMLDAILFLHYFKS